MGYGFADPSAGAGDQGHPATKIKGVLVGYSFISPIPVYRPPADPLDAEAPLGLALGQTRRR